MVQHYYFICKYGEYPTVDSMNIRVYVHSIVPKQNVTNCSILPQQTRHHWSFISGGSWITFFPWKQIAERSSWIYDVLCGREIKTAHNSVLAHWKMATRDIEIRSRFRLMMNDPFARSGPVVLGAVHT